MGNSDHNKGSSISDFISNIITNPFSQAPPENNHYLQISNSLQNNDENISFEIGGNEKKDMIKKDESIFQNPYKPLEDMNFSDIPITDGKEINPIFLSDESKIGFDGSSSSFYCNYNELESKDEDFNDEKINSPIDSKEWDNEFKSMFDNLDKDDKSYQIKFINSFESNNNTNDNNIINEEIKENNFEQSKETYNLNKKEKILPKPINLNLSKNNCSDSSKASTKDSSNNINNESMVINRKNPFVIFKDHENLIESKIKMDTSSCNLFCNLKRKRVREKVLKPGEKVEDIEKPLLREFKNYLLKKQNEFKEIFIKDKAFWEQFLFKAKTPPFKYNINGQVIPIKSFNQKLMMFIFSKEDVNILYEKFIDDTGYHIQRKETYKFKNEDKRKAYETYLKNFNKIYNKNYTENDLILDDFD